METEIKKQLIPWQKRKIKGNNIEAFWDTVIQVLLKPGEFFTNLQKRDSIGEPLLFNFIINGVALTFSFVAGIILWEIKKQWIANLVSIFVIIPMLALISVYSISLILHLFARVFKVKAGFKDTFNIVAYSGAANIINAIPFIGIYAGSLWGAALYTVALRKIYKLSLTKAIVASFSTVLIIYTLLFSLIIQMQKSSLKFVTQNEMAVQNNLKIIATAVEAYASDNNGVYPKDEFDLRYSKTPYLDRAYNNENIQGYSYLLKLAPKDYELLAAPIECGITGNKAYKVTTGGFMKKGDCAQFNK
jgi:hypothetical protein